MIDDESAGPFMASSGFASAKRDVGGESGSNFVGSSRIVRLADLVAGSGEAVDFRESEGTVRTRALDDEPAGSLGGSHKNVPRADRTSRAAADADALPGREAPRRESAKLEPRKHGGSFSPSFRSAAVTEAHEASDLPFVSPAEHVVATRHSPQTSINDRVPKNAQTVDGCESDIADSPPYEGLFSGGNAREGGKRRRPVKPPLTITQRAIGLLTRREHSRKELARKLIARGLDAGEVELAVAKLADAGWQDEDRFAASLVRARASGGYGPLHIRAELATHDLPQSARDAAFEAFDGDWVDVAIHLVSRRFGHIDQPQGRARASLELLFRRGFPRDIAIRAIESFAED